MEGFEGTEDEGSGAIYDESGPTLAAYRIPPPAERQKKAYAPPPVINGLPPEQHDVSNPLQNVRDIVKHAILVENYLIAPDTDPLLSARKHCVLVEIHLIDPKRRCPDCIAKHLLAIDGYLDEVLSLMPGLIQMSPFSDSLICRVFDFWRQGMDPIETATAVKAIRRILEDVAASLESHGIEAKVTLPDCVWRHLDAMEGYAEEIATLDEKGKLQELSRVVPAVRGLRSSLQGGVQPSAVAQSLRKVRKSIQPMVVVDGSK
jgi:hypothetical protein